MDDSTQAGRDRWPLIQAVIPLFRTFIQDIIFSLINIDISKIDSLTPTKEKAYIIKDRENNIRNPLADSGK